MIREGNEEMKNSENSSDRGTRTLARRRLNLLKSTWFFLLAVLVGLSIFTNLMNPRFLTTSNLMNILDQIAVLGIVSAGMTLLIISGEIDISVGANIGLSSCVMAMMIRSGQNVFLAIMVGIGLAVLNSTLVGATSILFKAPSFITSLAFISVFTGTALAITRGAFQTIYGQFETIGVKRFWGILPLSFLISIIAYVVVHILLSYTKLGRRTYAIGSNPSAAHLSGISVNKAKLTNFMLSGACVGVAAMVLLSRIGAAQPSTGQGLELRAIGAVVIGGSPLMGGKGKIIGTVLGVLLMGVISNVLNMLRVNPYFQQVTFGALILGALAVSVLSMYKKRGYVRKTKDVKKGGN
jgi:ribose transport system permease protein